MAITQMYHTCFDKIRQLRPKERVTRVRNMAWLLAGLFVGQCVHLSHIARKIPGASQKLSKVKMLSRLLNNRHIQVRSWYEPIARDLLTSVVAHGQPIRLLVDGTKVGNGHQLGSTGSQGVDRKNRRRPCKSSQIRRKRVETFWIP